MIMRSPVLSGLPQCIYYCQVNERHAPNVVFVFTKGKNFEPTQFKSGLIFGVCTGNDLIQTVKFVEDLKMSPYFY